MSFAQLFSAGPPRHSREGGNPGSDASSTQLADQTLAEFIDQYFLKLPYALAGGCREFLQFGSPEIVEHVLAQTDVDVIACGADGAQRVMTPMAQAKISESLASGCSLGIRHAHKHDSALTALAADFETFFSAPADIHLYMTPANSPGFGWHYDAEDVFVLQTAGTKLWELRKNTVNPWPLIEALPEDMRYSSEIMPLMRCTLQAGDWLYIPAGYWHRTKAIDESVSLSIGIASRTGIDVFDFVRQQLLDSLRWRQRLPQVVGNQGESSSKSQVDSLREHCRELGRDLERIFSAEATAQAFMNHCQRTRSRQSAATNPRDNELTTATPH